MKRFAAAILTLCLLLPACALAETGFSSDPDAIERAAKSVLMLEVYDADNELLATGSGFVAFDNRTLVTNYHVIEDADWMVANSDDGYEYMVTKVLVADEAKDIAICGFMSPTDLTPLTFSDGEALRRAEPIVAIGSPIGITNTVSLGNISAIYEEDGVSWIQFTAPISSGSSGGVLFDDRGCVIGVTSASYEDAQNLNLAVDIAEVTALYESWDGETKRLSEYVDADIKAATTPNATPTPRMTYSPTPKATPTPRTTYTPTPRPSISPTNTSKYPTLKRGDSGKAVEKLQKALIQYGYLEGTARGRFDFQTEKAVRSFNEQNFSKAYNVADEQTQFLLFGGNPEPAATQIPYSLLRRGDKGEEVRRLQIELIKLGYLSGEADGIFGLQTEEAVIEFNRQNFSLNHENKATQRMQCLLFEGNPKQYKDPAMALVFANDAYAQWNKLRGDYYEIRFQVTNCAKKKTVKAFELYVYAEDVWGNEIYDDYVYYSTTTKTVEPGKTVYSDYMTIPNASEISKVYCGIHKVAYTDGSIYSTDESAIDYVYWNIE